MTTACPVMNDAASEERNSTSCAISDGSLIRPIGIIGKTVSLALCSLPNMPVKRRHDRAGSDRVHANVLARDLQGDRVGETDDAPFAGAINRRRGETDDAEQRGGVDDRAAAVSDHMRHLMFEAQEYALQVHVDEETEIVFIQVLNGRGLARHAGIVEGDVDPAEPLESPFMQVGHCFRVADVDFGEFDVPLLYRFDLFLEA